MDIIIPLVHIHIGPFLPPSTNSSFFWVKVLYIFILFPPSVFIYLSIYNHYFQFIFQSHPTVHIAFLLHFSGRYFHFQVFEFLFDGSENDLINSSLGIEHSRFTLSGTPTMWIGGTSESTTDPAPIFEFSPMVKEPNIFAPALIITLLPMVGWRFPFSFPVPPSVTP